MRAMGLVAAVVGAVWCGAAAAATPLFPGVRYTRELQFTVRGPAVAHVVTAPRPVGLYSLKPVLSNESVSGRETVTSMQRRLAASATVTGVNGDLFSWASGHPTGVLIRSGVLDHQPAPRRSSIGVDDDGWLDVRRISFTGSWRGQEEAHPVQAVNEPAEGDQTVLFTRAWGASTPAAAGTFEVTLRPFPATAVDVPLTGTIVATKPGGRTPIPRDGAVLVARGKGVTTLLGEAAEGWPLTLRLRLAPAWPVVDALGGGPVLVRDGNPVFRALEEFTTSQVTGFDPRTAVGQRADGSLVFVAVDGRRPGYSAGITNFDLAKLLVRLGAVTASGLDSGGSTTLAFDGRLLNRPSDPSGERAVAEALVLGYTGAYTPPPAPLVSPNGDGIAEMQRLRYKVVERSTVDARLIGPDGTVVPVDAGLRAPGVRSFSWDGAGPDGAPALEGDWRWRVEAVDEAGRRSASERRFSLNRTLRLGGVRRLARRRVRVAFSLERRSYVGVRVLTPAGEVLRTLTRRLLDPGSVTVTWNGRLPNGRRAKPGTYVVRVGASNAVGRVQVARAFVLARH
jgi:hypothetical protein